MNRAFETAPGCEEWSVRHRLGDLDAVFAMDAGRCLGKAGLEKGAIRGGGAPAEELPCQVGSKKPVVDPQRLLEFEGFKR